MIKLLNILSELEKPQQIYSPGYGPGNEPDQLISKGFTTTPPEIDPETGRSTSFVKYLPAFKQMRIDLVKKRNEVKPFKFSSNPDIANTAKEVDKIMGKLSQLIFVLDKMVELQQKNR